MTGTTNSKRMSPSIAHGMPLLRKFDEGVQLFKLYRREARAGGIGFDQLFDEIDQYDTLLKEHSGVALSDASVFEIGFGARPHRQVALQSMGIDVFGVDAEAPVATGRPSQFLKMLRRNGSERATKTLIRHTLFDRGQQRDLAAALSERGLAPILDQSRLLVSDVGEVSLNAHSLDLIISEDVFEHIKRETLERVVSTMAGWLKPNGLALIRPNIFTGITGGHLTEWSRRALKRPPPRHQSEPWEHLRKKRFEANTYLNQMTREDYRKLFSTHFDIVEERVWDPDLGRQYFDAQARAELSDWSDDELFSNQTLFVLRPLV